MPGPKTIESISASTYQSLNGANFTLIGAEEKYKFNKGYASAFLGAATDFNKEGMFVVDLKGGYNYDKQGYFNQNLRIRHKMGNKTESVQIRYSPISADIPVGKNTNIYVNPHYSGQINLKNNKWTNSAGVFAGVTQKLNDKTALSVEAQRYNLQDIKNNSPENWSVNAIISYKF